MSTKNVSTAVLTVLFVASVRAFSPEIFSRIIDQLGSSQSQKPDKIASVAADLLDGGSQSLVPQTRRRTSVASLLQNPPAAGRRIIISNGAILFPKLNPSAYDYETTRTKLDLTPSEEQLLSLLRNVRDERSPGTTMRIAGGWVRDKLIYGRDSPSRDIDLVLSDTSGKKFAAKVCRYVEELGDGDIDGGDAAGAVARIQTAQGGKGARADHLQTASMRIGDYDVDFGCLRYERYDPDSRVPTDSRVASAVEDAWRRDLTINALYYNLQTNEVEDYTERGIRDLISQTIDTPKKPLSTLLEDPTRILRAVRFAAQLSFDVSPALIRAARDERVRTGLQLKASRDVIGASMDEIFGPQARDPARGIRLLMTTNLIGVVFPLGDERQVMTVYKIGLEYLSRTQSLVTRIFKQSPGLEWDISKRRFLWYAAFLKPIYEKEPADSESSSASSKRRLRQESMFYRLLQALKQPKTNMQAIESILKGVDPIQSTILTGRNNDAIQAAVYLRDRLRDVPPKSSRLRGLSELRWILYKALKPIGTMWKEAVLVGLASSQTSMSECIVRYSDLVSLVEGDLHLGAILQNKNEPKPMLNGTQIQQVFHGQIDGRGFKGIVEAMEEWQIRNVFYDVDAGDEKHSQMEANLVDYLLTTFVEYTNRQAFNHSKNEL